MACIEHVEGIAVDYLSNIMADNDNCTALLDGINTVFDLLGGDCIEAGGRLIEEDDWRVFEEHSGDCDTLLLSSAQLGSVALESFGKIHYLVVDICFSGGFNHLLVRCIGTSVADIFLDGAAENMILLKYEAYILAKHFGIPFLKRYTVERYAAAIR